MDQLYKGNKWRELKYLENREAMKERLNSLSK